jgi:hypothetical protein
MTQAGTSSTVPVSEAAFSTLPEATTDPFRPLVARVKSTLDLYRFTNEGASILEWAAAQTGLKDPLSTFSRQELERHFANFRIILDNHLRKLVKDLARQDPAAIKAIAEGLPQAAADALRRAGAPR